MYLLLYVPIDRTKSIKYIYDFVYLEKITLEIIIKITNFACIQIFFF